MRRPRPFLALRRRPRLWWALVALTAAAAGLLASSIAARAEAARAAWGETELVVIANGDIEVGDRVEPGDVTVEARPRVLVPAGALHALPDGAIASAAIVAGEVVVESRLAPAGLSPLAASLPAGTRAVAIPAELGLTAPLQAGDRVDVLVALAHEAAGDGPPGFTLVPNAVVVAVDEHAVTIAVPRDDAPRIAVALGAGAVSLALVGG